ncbi:MAG: hypothetical protein KIS94_03770 [Chitinophagales bacterium]|nr:hypothetical protein [Chitinophagales bacterium]
MEALPTAIRIYIECSACLPAGRLKCHAFANPKYVNDRLLAAMQTKQNA